MNEATNGGRREHQLTILHWRRDTLRHALGLADTAVPVRVRARATRGLCLWPLHAPRTCAQPRRLHSSSSSLPLSPTPSPSPSPGSGSRSTAGSTGSHESSTRTGHPSCRGLPGAASDDGPVQPSAARAWLGDDGLVQPLQEGAERYVWVELLHEVPRLRAVLLALEHLGVWGEGWGLG